MKYYNLHNWKEITKITQCIKQPWAFQNIHNCYVANPHRLLKERWRIEQGAITTKTDAEINLVSQVVLRLVERHQLVLDVPKLWVPCQHGVPHDGRLDEDHHPLLVDEPLAEGNEGRYDHGIAHFLDHKHGEGGLVPGEPLGGRILYCPGGKLSNVKKALIWNGKNSHNHGRIFHNSSTWPKLLYRTGCIEGPRSPAMDRLDIANYGLWIDITLYSKWITHQTNVIFAHNFFVFQCLKHI